MSPLETKDMRDDMRVALAAALPHLSPPVYADRAGVVPFGWAWTADGAGKWYFSTTQPVFSPRDANHVDLHAVYALPSAREERLAKALRPFDDFAEYLEVETEGFSDGDEIQLTTEDGFLLHKLKVADFRRARAALASPAVVEEAEPPFAWYLFDGPLGGWLFYRDKEDAPEDAKLEPLYTHPRPTPAAAVIEAARDVLTSWGNSVGHGERYVQPRPGDEGLGGYWSPAAAMVESSAIAKLRAALAGEKPDA
jgi:hypothetical protein